MTRRKLLNRCMLVLLSLGLALALAEVAYRWFGPGEAAFGYQQYYEDAERRPTDYAQAAARGDLVTDLPRNRSRWARAHTFYICYKNNPRADLDRRHCVPVHINSFGLRDREDLTYEASPGQRRVLCLGDSFTFGFGVAIEDAWVRRIEALLPAGVRTINCGAAGTLLVDEYWWALRDRFHKFSSDMVLVTICLNDLVPMPHTLALHRPANSLPPPVAIPGAGWSRLLAALQAQLQRRSPQEYLNLDPEVDWGDLLLRLPDRDEEAAALSPADMGHYLRMLGAGAYLAPAEQRRGLVLYTQKLYGDLGMPAAATWKNGGPQVALQAMRDWCGERRLPFGVVVWPLFQGLEAAATYPFHTLHRGVAEFCAAEGIAHLDLLPTFLGRSSASLWCDPSDLHANALAHELAAEPIARFVERVGGWR